MSREELIGCLVAEHREIEPGQDVEVGMFRPGDAQGISLAYYETYGDSFPIEHVYDPEAIIRLNDTEEQYNIVARTPRGEVVGLAGLFRHAPNKDVYEAGQLMVLKSYRKGQVANEIAREATGECPRRLGLPVVFCEAVSNHSVSQHLAYEFKMRFTGLEVECMPSSAYSKEGAIHRNVSLFLMFNVREKVSCVVHLPDEYEDMIESLYDDLELVRDRLPGEASEGRTEKSEFIIPDNQFVRMTVSTIGEDFEYVIKGVESKFKSQGVIQVYLNLGDPAAPEAVSLLRQRGYFFGGILPRWFEADGLVMQKVPQEPDWDGMQLYNEDAEAVHAFVRADYEAVRDLERSESE